MIDISSRWRLKMAAFGAIGWLLLATPLAGQRDSGAPTFETDIAPIFKGNCTVCHGGATPQAELDLTSLAGVLKGGKSGKAVVSGSSERSLLVEKIASGTMPPGKNKLDDKTVAVIRRWIETGANSETAGASPKTATAEALSENDVLPIFQMRCVLCHGKRRQEGGLDLRTQAARIKGGKSGRALAPGNPDESLLMKKILAGEMPPAKMLFEYAVRPPDSAEVETLRKWIAAGCPPAPEENAAANNAADPLVSDEARKFWSFEPLRRPPVPKVQHADRVRNPIDPFLRSSVWRKISLSSTATCQDPYKP